MPNREVKLGKRDYRHDERTLALGPVLSTDITVPEVFNFDKNRAPFPDRMWGNDEFGDCVIAARANQTLRIERVEQRRTLHMVDDDVISEYKKLTGCVSPGDANDTGLVMLNAMRDWKNDGWTMTQKPGHHYSIAAYGEIDPMNRKEVRASIYMLVGIQFGFALPWAARRMGSVWDYTGGTGPDWRPGSWGGHAVYGFGYDPEGITIKTWGQNVTVTNAFLEKYCDEAWGVVDALDSWRTKQTIDVADLIAKLKKISSHVDE